MRRVVVTGMAGVTPLGDTWDEISAEMEAGRTGVRYVCTLHTSELAYHPRG